MTSPRQLRLLLWKDYLVRKRKLVTLAGVIWATAVVLSLYIVRANVDNQDFPSCQFAARALPTAGTLRFIQSFVCSINNECRPLDQYDEIPTYENATLTRLERQLAPLIYNESVLEVASSVPDALKLLSKMADVVDEPTFIDISKNGLEVQDLFHDVSRVKRYLSAKLGFSSEVAEELMTARLSMLALTSGNFKKCPAMVSGLLVMKSEGLEVVVAKICSLSEADLQKIVGDLLLEVNFSKYVKMLGNMYYKISGDSRLGRLGDTLTAVLRMIRLQSFVPAEVVALISGEDMQFSYFDLDLISKLMDLIKPTFGDTESFKTIRDFTDSIVGGLRFLNKVIHSNDSEADEMEVFVEDAGVRECQSMSCNVKEGLKAAEPSFDVFGLLAQVTKMIHKYIPEPTNHEFLLYSTLISKLIELSNRVIYINAHIEEQAYEVGLRNPEGIKVLTGLPNHIVAKGFDALLDAERTQLLTSKLNKPKAMFCNANSLQQFFQTSKEEGSSLKMLLCTDAWNDYVSDFVKTLGIFEVKDRINEMASLLIQETLGKSTADQLYSIEQDFQVLKTFVGTINSVTNEAMPEMDWSKALNVTKHSQFMKTVRSRAGYGNQILVVFHGALAKEVVSQNLILSYKLSPHLIDITSLVKAINQQLDTSPKDLLKAFRDMYPNILETILRTANDENRTYKSLSTHSDDIFCNGANVSSMYLNFSSEVDSGNMTSILCNISRVIERGLETDSIFGKAVTSVRNTEHTIMDNVDWTELISSMKQLYVNLYREYPYLFIGSYGMDEARVDQVDALVDDATEMWFGRRHVGRAMRLGLMIGFRLLDLADRQVWNVTGDGWLKLKYSLHAVSGPVEVFHDLVNAVDVITRGDNTTSPLPPLTTQALSSIVPRAPALLADIAGIVLAGNTSLAPIISLLNADPPWPCSTSSLANLLELSPPSVQAVRGLEMLLCPGEDLQSEWRGYLKQRNITIFNLKNFNTTIYPPHTFLRFSSAFNKLIDDGQVVRDLVQEFINGSKDTSGSGVTWTKAWERVAALFNRTDTEDILKTFFTNVDTVISSINTTSVQGSLFSLWQNYTSCGVWSPATNETCRMASRSAWKYTLQFFSVMFKEASSDLLLYLTELYAPSPTLLQMAGFTSKTPLFDLYRRAGDYVGVLLNSYWDYRFMSQIRKASLSEFWDCEGILHALVPPPGSVIDSSNIKRVQPFICPSFLYWISLPKGDNTLLDVIAKPQYYFYSVDANDLPSSYEQAYNKINELSKLLSEISNKNQTLITSEDIKIDKLQTKLEKLVDSVLNYQINATDASYKNFTEINKKLFAANIYLTRVVTIISQLVDNLDEVVETDEIKDDLKSIATQYKRRPDYFVAFHFDLITDVLWKNKVDYKLVDALENACNVSMENKTILMSHESLRSKNGICLKSHRKAIYTEINEHMDEDYKNARVSLLNLVKILQNEEDEKIGDIFEFLNQRKQLINSLKRSISYAYELSIPIYLKYLQNNLRHYDVIQVFTTGGDWWSDLRSLYNGPSANKFFDSVEKSFEITGDVLHNLDKIHLVRLLRDINVNNSDAFCQPNITLSDYVPDSTGALSELKRSLCETDPVDLFEELPPLLFASQGYSSNLKLSKTVNYTTLNQDLAKTEALLSQNVPIERRIPQRPPWVTEDRINALRQVALGLLAKETLTSIAFGVVSNAVDAGTLFLKNNSCSMCSQLTSWVKQLNLQIFKKQEYDTLLCHIDDLTLEDVYHMLKYDFHWDMAIRELILTRNYTKYELNKSLNEFLELVKLHLLDDMLAEKTKLAECLTGDVGRNAFGNATLFVSVLSKTARLLRAQAPHLQEIDGFTFLPYFVTLEKQVSHNLDILQPLKKYVGSSFVEDIKKVVGDGVVDDIVDSDANLRLIQQNESSVEQAIILRTNSWAQICGSHDCRKIADVIRSSINATLIKQELPTLQSKQFWTFNFVSNILQRIELLLHHLSRLLAAGSKVDVQGVMEGSIASAVDVAVSILGDDVSDDVLYSLEGLVSDLHPLLRNTSLEQDLQALAVGLDTLRQFRKYLVDTQDLKVEVGSWFSWAERVQLELERLGVNHTNFWSLAAPRIRQGHLQLAPILTPTHDYHISNFVCNMESMAEVISPSDLGVVTAEDVFGATVEQFCGLDDARVKRMLPILMTNLNYTTVLQRVASILLPQLYASANLTQTEGDTVLAKYPQMMELIPVVQERVSGLGGAVPQGLVKSLGGQESLGGLLESWQFQEAMGGLLCGGKLPSQDSRFFKAIAQSQDFNDGVDQAQLDVLPTEFCRDMYKQISAIKGGKILWSFVKPLLMGKILYTPASPAVTRIVQQANITFAPMIKLVSLVHSFASAVPSLYALSSHRSGVRALRSLLSAPALASFAPGLADASVPDFDVDGLFEQLGDIQSLGDLLQRSSSLLQCINLHRFAPAQDEHSLAHAAANLSRVNEFSAGLVFLNADELATAKRPTNVKYKIRMDIDNAPTTARNKNYLWIPGPESNFVENMRYFRGFVQLQDMVDRAVIELSRSHALRAKRETGTDDQWAVYTQQEPYPCYRKDFYQTSLYESQAMIVAFFFSLLFTVASAVRFVVADKENGNTMLMSVMGVDLSYHTLSWLITSFIEMLVTVSCMTLVLKLGSILPRTDASLIFTLLLVFGISVLSFCYMMSKLFASASFAAVCTAIAYLVTFMPFVIILSLEAVISASVKLLVCLSMSSAISYSFLSVARSEAAGIGATWTHVWDAGDDDLSIAAGALMVLLDAGIYFAVGLLLDRFFGPKTLQSCVTQCTTTTEKAGVSITGVSKVYQAGSRRAKLALDNVSIELQQGQVTALLGHNGAGKTTLIKILTGTLKPSKGHITIRSPSSARTCIGVCPQNDVLFEELSAEEHVALYAQLKSGLPLEKVQDDVQSMLHVLSLGAVAHEPVSRLSGGTRRRLCVALAFVARPPLVTLDEPTAGVDPAARRDIWSMIVRLRQGRTILLTTHHLDEAELLSDQIVIMHKGQVHTTGSPIDIKRSLGNGYKLSVLYPKPCLIKPDIEDDDVLEQISMEERAKQLVTVASSCVRNAQLVDASDEAVEMQLPLFDHDGVHNDFLHLCTTLESQQPALGFGSYSLESSSLEHVFFNVCSQADQAAVPGAHIVLDYAETESASKSASVSSVRSDGPLVPPEGPVRGSHWQQFIALLHARYLHYRRNRWLLFLLFVLPSLFVATAMAFSLVRPPPDNEVSLRLQPDMYTDSTQYLVAQPSVLNSSAVSSLAERVIATLNSQMQPANWTQKLTPECRCEETRQECNLTDIHLARPSALLLPDAETLNDWIVKSHDAYIEKRYGGFSASIKNNMTYFVAWYNNKGHHALPAFVNALNNAILRAQSNDETANIAVYSHPLKISAEQISKDTVYQHVADAGISGLVLIGYSLVSAGAAVYLVGARRRQEKRLQLLSGVEPALYWAAALVADLIVILINMVITVVVFEAFGFPVFVARNNLPAICLLIFLYGFACGSLMHVAEKLFTEASMANMLLFCGNAFLGLAGLTLLLILDIISESDATDNARWTLHKIFLMSPQFALADGMLEVAKNTIQAQVLQHFGMDTYQDPLGSSLIAYHYLALLLVGIALTMLNLAIEYHLFDGILLRFSSEAIASDDSGEMEQLGVREERQRVLTARADSGDVRLPTLGNINAEDTFVHDSSEMEQLGVREERQRVLTARADSGDVRLPTLGNINAGFVDTEVSKGSIRRVVSPRRDVAQCVQLGKAYPALHGYTTAVRGLTLGIPPGQCTALLGQNGAGKSTTFAMLTGETRPTTGQICLNDRPVGPLQLCKGLISYCPQSDAIDPLMTVDETLRFYCCLRGITDQDEVIRRTVETFSLSRYLRVLTGQLSGGNRRKLCAALAFMGRSPLVLLDEPTSGMDPMSRQCVSRGVRQATGCSSSIAGSGASARAVMLSTHALDDARALAARVALLRDGRLCALASLDDCLQRFGGGYVVACRCVSDPLSVWRRVRSLKPHACLKVLHHAVIHFLLPLHATVNEKEVSTHLSDVFRLMGELQSTCDVDDFTVNQSSLDQMFLSFTDRDEDVEPIALEPLPSTLDQCHADRTNVTPL